MPKRTTRRPPSLPADSRVPAEPVPAAPARPIGPTVPEAPGPPAAPGDELHSHPPVVSPAFEHANDRMKLAAKPNDGQPLMHRDRAKAGRKG